MKTIRIISRLILGIVFIFSGFVKGIDPLGYAYKFTDYFVAFNMEALSVFSLPLSFIVSFLEFSIGAALLLGVFRKISSWLVLLFMCFFTPLTFYIAVANPVTDCGCFGDALIISNWQTFYKNIVLLIMAIIVFKGRYLVADSILKVRYGLFIIISIAYVSTVVWSYNYLPIIDFRPYKIGENIVEGMTVPEGAPSDVYRNVYFYKNKNTGKAEKFNDDNYPWQDTINWEFESMDDPILVSKGYEAPIHDFFIETNEGEDVTDYFLEDDNYSFMLVTYNLEKSSIKNQEKINNLADWALSEGYNFICLTSSSENQQIEFKSTTGAPYEFLLADEITLKTIIRSNPGLILLKSGTIMGKWHHNNIPNVTELSDKILPEMNKKLNED